MRSFFKEYQDLDFAAQAVPQLPWGQIVLLLQKVKEQSKREWYAKRSLEEGWSRSTLGTYVERDLYHQQAISANKSSNFLLRLPPPQSSLAHEILKSPYNFSFLNLHPDAYEREIEFGLTQHITKTLLELEKGFSFIGTQVPIEVSEQEFFIDMLFYHLKLRCYVVVELKAAPFKPEHAAQINFYLSAVDDLIKDPNDNPSIGLLLCKTKDKIIADYSLRNTSKPIGIAEYTLMRNVPDKFKGNLPTLEEIEFELNELPQRIKDK